MFLILFGQYYDLIFSQGYKVRSILSIYELLEVSNWCKAKKLSVNASKTIFMVLGMPQMTKYSHNVADKSVILDGTELSCVKKQPSFLDIQ